MDSERLSRLAGRGMSRWNGSEEINPETSFQDRRRPQQPELIATEAPAILRHVFSEILGACAELWNVDAFGSRKSRSHFSKGSARGPEKLVLSLQLTVKSGTLTWPYMLAA